VFVCKLSAHLDAYNLPHVISEDATRVVPYIDYDGSNDSIVGFVLPLGDNSLPEHGYYDAASFERIEEMLSTAKKSTFMNGSSKNGTLCILTF